MRTNELAVKNIQKYIIKHEEARVKSEESLWAENVKYLSAYYSCSNN